jgi:wobble nucleotide-excising tRNase
LAEGNDGKTYKLIRPNGSEVLNTLSDGEKNFISFLYFFHLLKGSHTESTLNNDRVVVFDDPVSSLDSDVLFIVSTLIRSLFEDLRNNNGTIKQIFILTHNVYFHKEISFKHNNKNEVSFWLIKKRGVHSIVEYLEKNPIKTSYDLLWDEVRAEPENRNNTTFQNTLRRILETYFNLAGISLDGLHAEFIAAEEKIMYKTLCSWVNAGSHGSGLFEDLNYAIPDEDTIEKYLQVFKKVFYKLGQISHYNMMMHIDTSEE